MLHVSELDWHLRERGVQFVREQQHYLTSLYAFSHNTYTTLVASNGFRLKLLI